MLADESKISNNSIGFIKMQEFIMGQPRGTYAIYKENLRYVFEKINIHQMDGYRLKIGTHFIFSCFTVMSH